MDFILVGVQSPTKINAPQGHTLSSGQWFSAGDSEIPVRDSFHDQK